MIARLARLLAFAALLVGVYQGSRLALVAAFVFVILLIESILVDLPFVEAESGVVERLRKLLEGGTDAGGR